MNSVSCARHKTVHDDDKIHCVNMRITPLHHGPPLAFLITLCTYVFVKKVNYRGIKYLNLTNVGEL